MTAYYNEHDPFAAAWLRELIKAGHIAPGDVDERSWQSAVWLPCRDGKARPVEPTVERLADGLSDELGLVRLESYPDRAHEERLIYAPLIQKGKARAGRLRGYGNAIVPPLAAEVITAYMEFCCQ